MLIRKSYCNENGIRLIFAGREGHHVVERNFFHRFEFRRSGFLALCLHDTTELPRTARMSQVSRNPRRPYSQSSTNICREITPIQELGDSGKNGDSCKVLEYKEIHYPTN